MGGEEGPENVGGMVAGNRALKAKQRILNLMWWEMVVTKDSDSGTLSLLSRA